jgi:2-amino-4-hydroxy-6-hydroxymethyldihydropteridine diphosphokinase
VSTEALQAPPERIYVGLGANLGDVRATFERAQAAMGHLPGTRRVAVSSLYQTAPFEAEGPDYLNAVVELASNLGPEALLCALQDIERAHGRERPFHHAPRTLDLDLLFYGQRQMQTPTLELPHPRLHLRGFVLRPLLELDPGLMHPTLGSLGVWADRARDQGVTRLP